MFSLSNGSFRPGGHFRGFLLHQPGGGAASLMLDQEYISNLARVRALMQAGQPLPRELAFWVEGELARRVKADLLRNQRDAYIRQAGAICGGSRSYQVRRILDENRVLDRSWARQKSVDPEPGTFRGAVHRARLEAPIPGRSRLHLILQPVHPTASQVDSIQ